MADKHVQEGGAWGVIVIFSGFFIQVVVFGSSQSIGVYNIEILRTFDVGVAAVSLVGSINLGLLLGGGPVSSFLMAKWSHRQVALLGATLSNIGLICMPFAPNLPFMYGFYGFLGGLGYSLVFVPSHILSGLYYSRYRSLSTGIVTAGGGFGSTVFPIIIYNCIQYYGWRGSLLILAGLNLHLFIFAALLRPVPKALLKAYDLQESTAKTDRHTNGNNDISSDNLDKDLGEQCNVYVIGCTDIISTSFQDGEGVHSKRFINGGNDMKHDVLDKSVGKYVTTIDVKSNRLKSFQNKEVLENDQQKNEIHGIDVGCLDETVKKHGRDSSVTCNKLTPQYREETTVDVGNGFNGSVDGSPCVNDNHFRVINNKVKYVDAAGSTLVPPIDTSTVQTRNKLSRAQKVLSHLKMVFIFDFSIFCLSNVCWNASIGIVTLFLPKYIASVGITEENASIALSLFGAGNGIGCVFGGLTGNIKCCDRTSLYISGNIGAGVFTMLMTIPYFHKFVDLVLLSSIVGFMYGIIMGLLMVVTSDLLGTSVLGFGYGYLMLSNGVGVLCGGPFAGALIDHFGSLEPALYLSACFTLCGGIVMTIVPLRRHCRRYVRSNLP